AAPAGPQREDALPEQLEVLGRDAVLCIVADQLSIQTMDSAHRRVTEPCGASRDRVEDGLNVRGRSRDDSEDLARRGLLLQRLGQLAVARLQLGEEADVLDGDDGLIREGLQ